MTEAIADPPGNTLYSVTTIACHYKVTNRTVVKWIGRENNPLKAHRAGGQWRIRHSDLREFVQIPAHESYPILSAVQELPRAKPWSKTAQGEPVPA